MRIPSDRSQIKGDPLQLSLKPIQQRPNGRPTSGSPPVSGSAKGSAVSVLIAQSDLNHSRKLVDAECVMERGANVAAETAS
jgi:hypothetical protein